MEDLFLIPPTLSISQFVALTVLSFFTSMLTAAFGIGGGILLLATMAQMLPAKALIPVHGVVQLGSNTGRALIMVKTIATKQLTWFIIGSLIGAAIGGNIVVSLPTTTIQLMLGSFIIITTWAPKFSSTQSSLPKLTITGALSTFLTMFVAATGPFVMATLRPLNPQREVLVATHAACMVAQHFLKVIVFGLLGFAFSAYLGLVIAMIASGFIGTLVGRRLLLKIDEAKFQKALNIVLTALAIKLIYSALTATL